MPGIGFVILHLAVLTIPMYNRQTVRQTHGWTNTLGLLRVFSVVVGFVFHNFGTYQLFSVTVHTGSSPTWQGYG